MVSSKNLRAIDLYSGIGGWSLGLRLAGIDVVSSYEHWGAANETNFKNNQHQAQTVDIRGLSLSELPSDIDIVVGSPPCTQFSYSNRGGGGDIEDGLKDIIQFLKIVDHLKPKFWVMENVPRVAKIINEELKLGGALEKFAHLGCHSHIVNMAEYGLPQRRKRCIAGNFDFDLLETYRKTLIPKTLGDVVTALKLQPIVDPLFGLTADRDDLIDHVKEDILNEEEARINRANKTIHTVYNSMPFPDPLDKSVRTITATCTRVSRESIVIAVPGKDQAYRRLTIRERACLQGFPITYQFYGKSYSQKLRMIGNAIPPAFSYQLGCALKQTPVSKLTPLKRAAVNFAQPSPIPIETRPDRAGRKYPSTRTFKFAIPSLRLKSGVRFELTNDFDGASTKWRIAFYFGNSKAIQTIDLNAVLFENLIEKLPSEIIQTIDPKLANLKAYIAHADISNMQTLWAHKGPGRTRSFMVLDEIDSSGAEMLRTLSEYVDLAEALIENTLRDAHGADTESIPGKAKLLRNAPLILSGLLIGSLVNHSLNNHWKTTKPNHRKTAVNDPILG